MVVDDWAQCANCKFPCIRSQMIALLEIEAICPMCDKSLDVADVKTIHNPLSTIVDTEEVLEGDSPTKSNDVDLY